jgi:hypothetical protein
LATGEDDVAGGRVERLLAALGTGGLEVEGSTLRDGGSVGVDTPGKAVEIGGEACEGGELDGGCGSDKGREGEDDGGRTHFEDVCSEVKKVE